MNARVLIDLLRQRVDIGVLELGNLAVLGDKVDNRVLVAQFVQLAGGGAVARFAFLNIGAGQFQIFEQYHRQLCRAGDIEFLARMGMDLLLDIVNHGVDFDTHFLQIFGVEFDAFVFHPRQYRDDRPLDIARQFGQFGNGIQLFGLRFVQRFDDGDHFGSTAHELVRGQIIKRFTLILQVGFAQLGQRLLAPQAVDQKRADQHVVTDCRQLAGTQF